MEIRIGVVHTPKEITLGATDIDTGDITKLTYSIETQPAHGTVSLNAADTSKATYTPAADYNGADTLSIFTSDLGNTGSGGAKTDIDTMAITITPVADVSIVYIPFVVKVSP